MSGDLAARLRHRAREPGNARLHSRTVKRSGVPMPSNSVSDKAIAVFAFAAYHQLSSGEPVVDVVLEDGAGHAADPQAIAELEAGGLVTKSGDRAAFTETGRSRLAAIVAAIRNA